MKRWLRSVWAWSGLVTVPLVVLFAAWAAATWRHLRMSAHDPFAGPWQIELHDAGAEAANHLLRHLTQRLRPSDISDVPEKAQLRNIQLFVNDEEEGKLERDLPYSGFDWANALLAYGDGLHKVDLRYRGDSFVHWGYAKKSMRVRTATTDLFFGMREFNLIVPRFPLTGDNYCAYRLAKAMGLITPRCELVNVLVNGRLVGVMEFTERLDEGTLRDHDRMPGDLYAGELALRDARRGTSNRVFELPRLWEKLAANNHYDLESRAPLEELCRVLAMPQSEAAHARLAELLDVAAWGRFLAFELLAQTVSYDEMRNWRLFWDPWRRTFEPVVWDPAGWAGQLGEQPAAVMLDVAPSRLHAWLLANGACLAARQVALQQFFDTRQAAFLDEVGTTVERLGHALHHDPNIHPADETVVQAALHRLPQRLRRVFDTIRTEHLQPPAELAWAVVAADTVRLQVTGRTPVQHVELKFARPLARAPIVHVRVQHADGPHTVVLPPAAAVATDDALRIEFGGGGQSAPTAQPGSPAGSRRCVPSTFDLQLVGWSPAAEDGPAAGPVSMLAHGPAGQVQVRRVDALPLHVHDGLFAALPAHRAPAPQLWSGEVVIDGVREVHDDVHLAPGTVVRLGAKASLLFHGQVLADGTAERPIRFVPAREDQDPWGTVAIDGPACRGSLVRHCEFRGGSGYKVPLAEYCSMVSVHNCEQVRISDCWFGENHQYDDLVHVMYADVVFERVTLAGARADALDCDISTVIIRDSMFTRSGNDGVDLMTTRALIEGCRFEANGDKGVSIGEGSRLVVLRSTFDGCNKAMEAKDGSTAHAVHCELRRCTKAANAYKKNWRYDAGGSLTVHRSIVVGNGALPTADTWSRIELVDCSVVGEAVAEYDQEYVDGTSTRMRNTAVAVDCDPSPRPRRSAPPEFPAELADLQATAGAAWRAVWSNRRGSAP